MNRYKDRLCVLAGLFICASAVAEAEDLLDIYERALQFDPILRQAEAGYLAILELKPQARSALLPFVSLSAGASSAHTTDPNRPTSFATGQVDPDIESTEVDRQSSTWNVGLTQTVFDWGQFLTLRQTDKRLAQAEIDFQMARQDLLVRVATTYFLVLAAEDTLASETAAREAIGRQLEQAERRFEVGLIAITDVQEAQAGYDQAIAAEILAEQNLATTHEFLREIIGESVIDLAGPAQEIPLLRPDPADAQAWVQTAMDRNLILISSRIGSDIAQDEIAIQRSFRLPRVSLSGRFGESGSETVRINNLLAGARCRTTPITCPPLRTPSQSNAESYSVSLSFSIPIFTGGYNSSRIQQSVYQHRASLEALEGVARATERETRDAYLSVISEISRVMALRQAVESSQTALRATEAGFEVGTRTTVDVLVSQNNLRAAETTYARSRYDYILNVLRLKLAAGSLNVADFEEVNGWLATE